jgi:hypothetical protein
VSGLLDYIVQAEMAQDMADEFGRTFAVVDWSETHPHRTPIVAIEADHAYAKGYDVLGLVEPRTAMHGRAA